MKFTSVFKVTLLICFLTKTLTCIPATMEMIEKVKNEYSYLTGEQKLKIGEFKEYNNKFDFLGATVTAMSFNEKNGYFYLELESKELPKMNYVLSNDMPKYISNFIRFKELSYSFNELLSFDP